MSEQENDLRNGTNEEQEFDRDEFMNMPKDFENIEGIIRTYKTGEVAKMLMVSTGMVRYYCREFSDFVGIESNPGEHRTYSHNEIMNLKYIVYLLKIKNMSVAQAKEFLASPKGRLYAPQITDEERINSFVTAVANQMRLELGNVIRSEVAIALEGVKDEVKLALTSSIEEQTKSIEGLGSLIEEKVNRAVNENLVHINELSEKINGLGLTEMHDKIKNVDEFITDWRKKQIENQNKQPDKKGLFSRLFK